VLLATGWPAAGCSGWLVGLWSWLPTEGLAGLLWLWLLLLFQPSWPLAVVVANYMPVSQPANLRSANQPCFEPKQLSPS